MVLSAQEQKQFIFKPYKYCTIWMRIMSSFTYDENRSSDDYPVTLPICKLMICKYIVKLYYNDKW